MARILSTAKFPRWWPGKSPHPSGWLVLFQGGSSFGSGLAHAVGVAAGDHDVRVVEESRRLTAVVCSGRNRPHRMRGAGSCAWLVESPSHVGGLAVFEKNKVDGAAGAVRRRAVRRGGESGVFGPQLLVRKIWPTLSAGSVTALGHKCRVPMTVLRPGGRVSSPKEARMAADTPRGRSVPGIREVSMRTFSWCSLSRRHAPRLSGTKVVMSLTNLSGAGMENSVMMAQSGPTRPRLLVPVRAVPHSRSQMSIASTPLAAARRPSRSAPGQPRPLRPGN